MKKSFYLFSALFFSFYISFCQSTVSGNFIHNNINRSYRIYIPASYDGTVAVPLVLNLHGYGSNAIEQELYTNFKSIADTANFILVHPNGSFDGLGNRFWNTFGNSNVDDLGFISTLIDTISSDYNLDINSIYSTGMSNGGFMSQKLACNLSKIAAIASVTGTMTWDEYINCLPLHPTPVMQIHGTADAIVPYNGSVFFVPVDSVISYWVKKNNCDSIPVFNQVPDINTNDNCTAELYIYQNGDNGSVVELYKIIDGGHSWPGAPVNIAVTNQDFSASAEIWRFFRKFKLNNLTTIKEVIPFGNSDMIIYPNPASGNIHVKFNNQSHKQIKVIDLYGKLIYDHNCHNCNFFHFQINSKGFFIISVEEDGKNKYGKILVK
jgi:polyhydroxybutyrate depolymerase